ncbi:MAG: sigma-70 family RNA polymerase sigma factor [bacterium]
MNTPSFKALQQGDPHAWDDAFDWLWPTAFAVVNLKLARFCPEDVEDVAIQALETLVEKVATLKSVDELKPLTARIAHNLAVSRLRKKYADKHGGGKIDSLNAMESKEVNRSLPSSPGSPLDELHENDLTKLLTESQEDLKHEIRDVLNDFFISKLTYDGISQKRGIPIGTVGVMLKRGLEAIRQWGKRHPGLMKELEAFAR